MIQRAAVFYKNFSGLKEGICNNLKTVWQRDLGCEFEEDDWMTIIANAGKYIKEARGKFTQYKLIHRFYYTPSKLNRMGLLQDSLCWKCKTETGTFLHVLWECELVHPFWEKIIEYLGKCLDIEIPVSPRLCLLGDQTQLPDVSKYDFAVIKVGLITAARNILRLWKSTSSPDPKKWKEDMAQVVSYEHMLLRLNNNKDRDRWKWSWDRYFAYSITRALWL